ncbi:MAG: Polymyxin resistance protein ArnC, glycosyl transferase [uncultured Solirubrobacteraceae bacterium]|uniref:Polymyxin resistance protein ArnC, glycosyl transferase n=2 Tax=uncultured Solirubrobacteraceae bacterium TaxID=1162706 RepID=A0A6J4S649_9ACTN|nr:MAG: Polymyxin resistance protein ArnC, glycosyl transferase [uncultured Solirubrobacteraceae bacterium]
MARELHLLSVVAPMLDEERVVGAFHARVSSALAQIPYELVIVDDGSTDGTPALLDEIERADERVRVVHLSRPFGHQLALTAGLDHARGDAVVLIDGDLQDPPEVIPQLVERWRDGVDVVVAKRRVRAGETRFKLATARGFYALMGRLAQVPLEPNAGDFRLLDRQVVDALGDLRERNRFLRGMTAWVGFETDVVEYDREARSAGATKFSLGKMLRFGFDGVTSFSHVPLQIATLLGLAFAVVAFALLPLTIIARYAGIYDRGVPSVLFAVLLIGGIQLMTLGVIGEYVGRIYDEVKRRPLYVVKRREDEAEHPE